MKQVATCEKKNGRCLRGRKKRMFADQLLSQLLNVGNVGSDAKFELAKDGNKRKNQCFKAAVASVVPDDD